MNMNEIHTGNLCLSNTTAIKLGPYRTRILQILRSYILVYLNDAHSI
jgi:hypothetical protein